MIHPPRHPPPYLATGYDEKVSSIRSAELPIYVSEIVARFGAKASFTPMGNEVDSRRLAQCRDTVYGTPSNTAVHLRRAERPKGAAGAG
jgi:hypothetical protein